MEKTLNKVAKNTFFLASSQVVSRLIGFIYFVFLARELGVENFGIYVFIISLVYNFVPVADFGLERLVLRDVSRGIDSEYLSKLVPLRLVLAFFAFVLCLLLGLILKLDLVQIVFLAIYGLSIFFVNITNLVTSFLNAKEKMQYMAGAGLATVILTAFFGALIIYFNLNLVWLFFSYSVSCLLVGGYFFNFLRRTNLNFKPKIDFNLWKKSLSQSWVFAVFTILAVFYLRSTLIMTKIFLGENAVGIYGSVFKFVEALILIPQSLALALFPLSSKLSVGSPKKLAKLYLKGLGVLFLISLPVVEVMTFFPEKIVMFAYGESYLKAVEVLPVLGLSMILFFVNSLPGNIIQNSDKVKKFLPFSILIFLFIFLIGYLVIPIYGLVGAAWSVVAGEAFGFIVSNIFVYKLLKLERASNG